MSMEMLNVLQFIQLLCGYLGFTIVLPALVFYRKVKDFPVLIRADYNCRHEVVARVMNAVTAAGIWKISFMAVQEDKTSKPGHPGRKRLSRLKGRSR